jgi:hypothetical protein
MGRFRKSSETEITISTRRQLSTSRQCSLTKLMSSTTGTLSRLSVLAAVIELMEAETDAPELQSFWT